MAFRDTGLSCVDNGPLTLTLAGYGMRWDGNGTPTRSSHTASFTSRRRGIHGMDTRDMGCHRAGTPHTDRKGNERDHERISSDGSTCLPCLLTPGPHFSLCVLHSLSSLSYSVIYSCRSRGGNGCYSLRLSPSLFWYWALLSWPRLLSI